MRRRSTVITDAKRAAGTKPPQPSCKARHAVSQANSYACLSEFAVDLLGGRDCEFKAVCDVINESNTESTEYHKRAERQHARE